MMDFEFWILGLSFFRLIFASAFLFFFLPSLFLLLYFFCLSFLFEPFRIYLYIGITSLCLYNTSKKSIFQDAILYKINNLFL